jgi:hypothetical protein
VAALALLATDPMAGDGVLRNAVTRIANSYLDVTGPLVLNEAGDRALGDYDFWALEAVGGGHEWRRVAQFEVSPGLPGRLVRSP